MAYIYTDQTNRLILGNEEYVRQMNLPFANWNKLRIGFRWSLIDTGSNISNFTLLLGLCEGTANTFRSANTTGYIGYGLYLETTMVRQAGTYGPQYGNSSNSSHYVQRSGNNTVSTLVSHSYSYWDTAPTGNLMWIDWTKPGTNLLAFDATIAFNTTSTEPITQYSFWTYAEQEINIPGGYQKVANAGGNITYTGNNINALDTISINYNKSTPVIEVMDIIALRFA